MEVPLIDRTVEREEEGRQRDEDDMQQWLDSRLYMLYWVPAQRTELNMKTFNLTCIIMCWIAELKC